MAEKLLPTTVVGSYPQPDWLIDRGNLRGRLPPRVRATEIWRVAPAFLDQAQNDATLIAIRDMECAGIDIITDGEMRRESYSNRFATALDGVDIDQPGSALDRTGHANPVPRVVGPIRRARPVEVEDVRFLRANTDRRIKITMPGPFTMAQQAQNDFYKTEEELAFAYAAAVNAEARALKAAGADVIQLDEPYLQARPDKAKRYGVAAINRALDGVPGPTALHLCFGYAHVVHARPSGYSFLPELAQSTVDQISIEAAQPNLDPGALRELAGKTIILGVISLGDPQVESAETVAARIRRMLGVLKPERVIPAPDCGMKYLDRATAFAKLQALAAGAALVRKELTG
jgi:5-methyltetrahydropteroyltriglutamate--homocysteine methyltransferase